MKKDRLPLTVRVLNRIATWTEEGIEYEGDQRHVEICVVELGLNEEIKEVVTPSDRSKGKEEGGIKLGKEKATRREQAAKNRPPKDDKGKGNDNSTSASSSGTRQRETSRLGLWPLQRRTRW